MKKTVHAYKYLAKLSALTLLGCSSATHAATVVNVDFGTGSGTQVGLAAAPDVAGGTSATWNGIGGASPTASDLLDSEGNATSVGLDFNSRGSFSNPNDQELNSGQAALFGDYLSSRANNNLFDLRAGNVISGLVAGNLYDLYIYGQGDNFEGTDNNGGQNVGIQIGSEIQQTGYDGTSGGDGLLVEGIEFVLFTGLEANADGEITFDYFNPGTGTDNPIASADDADANNSRFSAINGFQIVGDFTAVPEPSSSFLVSLSAIGLLARRRR